MTVNRSNATLLFVMLATTLLAIETWISRSTALVAAAQRDVLGAVITLDLTIGIPLLYYFLLARRKYAPKTGVVTAAVLSLVAVRILLPPEYWSGAVALEALVPLIEVVVLAAVARRVRSILRHSREAGAIEVYFSDRVRTGLRRGLGQPFAATLLANEIALAYYALVGPFTRPPQPHSDRRSFSYHRQSGFVAFVGGVFFFTVLETVTLHLLLQRWNTGAAWTFTALSVYSLIWLLGYFQSARLEPILVDSATLYVRAGFRWRTRVRLANIQVVRRATRADAKAQGYLNLAVFGEPRLVIVCQQPVETLDFFGRPTLARVMGVTVDDERSFLAYLNERLDLATEL